MRTIDAFEAGDELAPYELHVSRELNLRYVHALEDEHPRYVEGNPGKAPWVHPGLLLNHSNPTRSASHVLPDGMANIHAKDEVEFFRPGRVGETFRIYWKVVEKYEKRGRNYMIFECRVVGEDGAEVLRRRMTSTFSRGRG